jgi:hypothetical protein
LLKLAAQPARISVGIVEPGPKRANERDIFNCLRPDDCLMLSLLFWVLCATIYIAAREMFAIATRLIKVVLLS